MVIPTFFQCDVKLCRSLGKLSPAQGGTACYISEPFDFILFGDMRSSGAPEIVSKFRVLIRKVCPLFEKLVEPRFLPSVLLRTNSGMVDLAFLDAVWRYSAAVGKAAFAEGLFDWPLSGEFISSVPIAGPVLHGAGLVPIGD